MSLGKYRNLVKEYLPLIVAIVLIFILFLPTNKNPTTIKITQSNSSIKTINLYCMVSNTCPHCKGLEIDLSRLGYSFKRVDPRKFISLSSKFGIKDFGTPQCVVLINSTYYFLIGYPSYNILDIYNGTYGGLEKEEKLCKEAWNGKPYYKNNKYLWCVEKEDNNFVRVIGNRNFLKFIVENCKYGYCKEIKELEG